MASNAVMIGSGSDRLCRAFMAGTLYSGRLDNGICRIGEGGVERTSINYEVAVGIGKWDGPGTSEPLETGGF